MLQSYYLNNQYTKSLNSSSGCFVVLIERLLQPVFALLRCVPAGRLGLWTGDYSGGSRISRCGGGGRRVPTRVLFSGNACKKENNWVLLEGGVNPLMDYVAHLRQITTTCSFPARNPPENSPNLGESILSSKLSPHGVQDQQSSSIKCPIPSFHIWLVPILHLDAVRLWFTVTLAQCLYPTGDQIKASNVWLVPILHLDEVRLRFTETLVQCLAYQGSNRGLQCMAGSNFTPWWGEAVTYCDTGPMSLLYQGLNPGLQCMAGTNFTPWWGEAVIYWDTGPMSSLPGIESRPLMYGWYQFYTLMRWSYDLLRHWLNVSTLPGIESSNNSTESQVDWNVKQVHKSEKSKNHFFIVKRARPHIAGKF